MGKKTTVTLGQVKNEEIKQEFGFQHALNLLRYEAKSGRQDWKVVDKNWQFKENELIRSTKHTQETEK